MDEAAGNIFVKMIFRVITVKCLVYVQAFHIPYINTDIKEIFQ